MRDSSHLFCFVWFLVVIGVVFPLSNFLYPKRRWSIQEKEMG
jgi:hypothetical protein